MMKFEMATLLPADMSADSAAWTDVAPLHPGQLGPEAEAALRALLSEGESPNTLRSYQADQ